MKKKNTSGTFVVSKTDSENVSVLSVCLSDEGHSYGHLRTKKNRDGYAHAARIMNNSACT